MPLYEYECKQCHRHTEKRQKFSDTEITECPHCGGTLERVISAPAIAFKGGGWYKDLYSSPKPVTNGDKAEAKSESKNEGTANSGSPAPNSDTSSPAPSATPAPASAPAPAAATSGPPSKT